MRESPTRALHKRDYELKLTTYATGQRHIHTTPPNQPASTRTHIPTKSRMHVHTEYMPTYDVTVCYSAKQHTQFPIHPYRCDAQLNFPLPNSGE